MSWTFLALVPVLACYLLLMVLLFMYVLNHLYLAARSGGHRGGGQTAAEFRDGDWPRVTVQLPIYNEVYVAERVVRAAANLDYPRDRLEIQVLDDSTDETVERVAAEIERQRARGLDIVHVRRGDRTDFKAGALANGLSVAKGEYVAIFDADFLPGPDFLRRMLPHFDDAGVAFVQARWSHLNRDYSLLTILQALSLDAHFAVDQTGRSGAGVIFNFNGTAGIWRKAAIEDAGGWRADTLTEDLDLSYRVFLRGWTARYADDVDAAAELPVSFTAFRQQQYRWARGSMEVAIRILPQVWRAKLPFVRKFSASMHLTAYMTYFLTLGLIIIFPALLGLSAYYPHLLDPAGLGLLPNLMFFVPALYFIVGQHRLGQRWLGRIPLILTSTILASGMTLNTLNAALQMLRRKKIPFERTPKYGIRDRRQDWRENRYPVGLDSVVLFEGLLAAFTLWTASIAWRTNHWLMMAYSLFFAAGLLFFSGATIFQAVFQRPWSEMLAALPWIRSPRVISAPAAPSNPDGDAARPSLV